MRDVMVLVNDQWTKCELVKWQIENMEQGYIYRYEGVEYWTPYHYMMEIEQWENMVLKAVETLNECSDCIRLLSNNGCDDIMYEVQFKS